MSKHKQKSLKINMVLNAIKGLLGIVFPLITFPYVSRVLGVDNLGRYNFANSIISYLVLLAGLGISAYAIREGARIRDDKNKMNQFCSEMLCINLYSTALSYLVFFILLLIVPKFVDYRSLLLIFSLQIIFRTIGVEWIYSIYEDYAYITIRSIVFQIISLILLFVLVKKEADVNIYAAITVFSAVGSNVLNFVHSRRYCRFSLVKNIDLHRHLKPILILFAMAATVTIYVSSDLTILGFVCNDHTVGIYSVSTKVYTIIKTVLSSVLVVSVPRLSALLGNDNKKKFNETSDDIYKTLITLVLPVISGIIVLKKEIVLILSSQDYLAATSSLSILSIALFFCMGAWFWGQCILVPFKLENTLFKITIISALVNIGLNFVMIPFWSENAAALTTVIAEAISFVWSMKAGRKYVNIQGTIKHYFKVLAGCGGIIAVGYLVSSLGLIGIEKVVVTIPAAVIVYFVIELILKNESVRIILDKVVQKVKNNR